MQHREKAHGWNYITAKRNWAPPPRDPTLGPDEGFMSRPFSSNDTSSTSDKFYTPFGAAPSTNSISDTFYIPNEMSIVHQSGQSTWEPTRDGEDRKFVPLLDVYPSLEDEKVALEDWPALSTEDGINPEDFLTPNVPLSQAEEFSLFETQPENTDFEFTSMEIMQVDS